MAIEDDVLVIGGGLAGATAALAATDRNPDARIRLLSHKQSTLRHATGLIDVLGYTPGGNGPLADPFEGFDDLPAGHPYERIGSAGVREALDFFDDVSGSAYRGGHTDANALVPTSEGSIKPTARYPAGTADGLASDPRDTLLVGFETMPDFDAPLAAAHLAATGVPFETRGVTLSFPGIRRADAKVTRYAHLLDHDERVSTSSGMQPAREALADRVRSALAGEDRVGFPAILGDEHAEAVRADLASRLGVDVFEVPMGPPSLPGLRLEDLLYDAMEAAGVRITTGVPVVDYEPTGDGERVDCVLVDRKGATTPYRAEQYVLATGGLVGKGIRSERQGGTADPNAADPDGVGARDDEGDADEADGGEREPGPDTTTTTTTAFEPIFDCHVATPEDRYDWFDEAAFGEHPFARFGVAVDRELRPLDEQGAVEFANLRAAGAVIGGYDYPAEKSGAGVSLATGYVAGSTAGTEVIQ